MSYPFLMQIYQTACNFLDLGCNMRHEHPIAQNVFTQVCTCSTSRSREISSWKPPHLARCQPQANLKPRALNPPLASSPYSPPLFSPSILFAHEACLIAASSALGGSPPACGASSQLAFRPLRVAQWLPPREPWRLPWSGQANWPLGRPSSPPGPSRWPQGPPRLCARSRGQASP